MTVLGQSAWPTEFLWVTTLVAGLAAIFPWCFRRFRWQPAVAIGLAVAATGTWWAYEAHLSSWGRPGDPLIRVDLLWLRPMLFAAWLGAVTSAVVALIRRRRTSLPRQDTIEKG